MLNGTGRKVMCALVLTVTLGASKIIDSREPRVLVQPLESIPANIDGWAGVNDPPLDAFILGQLRASSRILRTYHRGEVDIEDIGVFVAYYSQQRPGENIHSPKGCLPGNGWEIVQREVSRVPANGAGIEVNLYHIQNADTRRLVLYWYQSRKRIVANEYAAKAFLIWDAFRYGDTSNAVVRVTISDSPTALETGTAFAAALIPEVQRCLGR